MCPDASSAESPRKIAIIGGGISGLSAAHRLLELADEQNRSVAVTLFEAGARAGGIIATERIGDYLVELGADSFITNKPAALDLCRRLGLEDQLIPTQDRWRRSLVLRKGKPVEVPEGFMLLAPAKVGPVLTSPIFSLCGKLRMGFERFIPGRRAGGDESLASFVRRRFGRETLERLIQPLVGGIYTSDPERLSLQATMPRFLDMEREYGSLIKASRQPGREPSALETSGSGARYGLFLTLRDGLQTLFDRLLERIQSEVEIRLTTRVASLEQKLSGWRIRDARGNESDFDAVVVALPAYRAGELCRSFAPDLQRDLESIEYASSAIVVSGHSLADVRNPLDAFGLVIPEIERRKIIAVSFSSRKFPGRAPEGKVLLRTFVGGAMHPEMMFRSDEQLLEIVREELRDLLGVGGTADFARVVRYQRAMPQYYVGHLDMVGRIERRVGEFAGLALAGNAYRGVGIPDSVRSGESAAEAIW